MSVSEGSDKNEKRTLSLCKTTKDHVHVDISLMWPVAIIMEQNYDNTNFYTEDFDF